MTATRRSRLVVVMALVAGLAAGCGADGSDDDARVDESTSSTRAPDTAGLGAEEFGAACLTEQTSESRSPIDVDLCVGDLSGRVRVVRRAIDAGIGPAVAPDGTRIAFVDEAQLRVLDVVDDQETNLEEEALAPEWLPDGRVAFIASDGRSIAAIDPNQDAAAETIVRPETLDQLGGGWTVESFAVSPDQGRLVLSLFRAEGTESALAVVRIDDAEASILAGPGADPLTYPAFSPDGQQVAYAQGALLVVRPIAGGEPQRISPENWYATGPTWSPDGRRLLWLANAAEVPEGPAAIVVADVDQPESVRVVVGSHGGPLERLPAFPDWPADVPAS